MFVTLRRLIPMACLLSSSFLWPSSSWALGLGEIHLNSALNEPMNAEIDLLAATPDELTALRHALIWRWTSPVASLWFRAAISSAPGTRSTAPRRRILMFPPNASGLARYTAIMV